MKMKRAIALSLAVLMIVAASVAGTIAWLQDKTPDVTNTFAPSNIDISLKESPIEDKDSNGNLTYGTPDEGVSNEYPIVPGFTYTKDPVVKVEDSDVDCYLFVKFEENNNPATYYEYTSTLTTANGWTQGDGTDIPSNVWYREVKTTDTNKSWNLLDGDEITVKDDEVTKETMAAADAAELKWTAYATQLYKSNGVKFTAKEAWDIVKPTT